MGFRILVLICSHFGPVSDTLFSNLVISTQFDVKLTDEGGGYHPFISCVIKSGSVRRGLNILQISENVYLNLKMTINRECHIHGEPNVIPWVQKCQKRRRSVVFYFHRRLRLALLDNYNGSRLFPNRECFKVF